MKKAVLGILISLAAVNARAAVEVIATKSDGNVTILDINGNLRCELLDRDHDGVKETTVVTLKLESVGEPIGILQKSYISEETLFDQNDLCGKVKTIKDQSPMNFGAGLGTFDAVVYNLDGVLTEELQVTLSSYPDNAGKSVSVVLNQQTQIPTGVVK